MTLAILVVGVAWFDLLTHRFWKEPAVAPSVWMAAFDNEPAAPPPAGGKG